LHKRAFRKEFGTDAFLMELTNKYVAGFELQIIGGSKSGNKNTPYITATFN